MICPFQTEGKRQLEAWLLLCLLSESLFRQAITWQSHTHPANESLSRLRDMFSFSAVSFFFQKKRQSQNILNVLQLQWHFHQWSLTVQIINLVLLCNPTATQCSIIWYVSILEVQTFMKDHHPLCCLFSRNSYHIREAFSGNSVILVLFKRKPLLNAAAFWQLSGWQFVFHTPSKAPLSILGYNSPLIILRVIFFSLGTSLVLAEHQVCKTHHRKYWPLTGKK